MATLLNVYFLRWTTIKVYQWKQKSILFAGYLQNLYSSILHFPPTWTYYYFITLSSYFRLYKFGPMSLQRHVWIKKGKIILIQSRYRPLWLLLIVSVYNFLFSQHNVSNFYTPYLAVSTCVSLMGRESLMVRLKCSVIIKKNDTGWQSYWFLTSKGEENILLFITMRQDAYTSFKMYYVIRFWYMKYLSICFLK